MEQGDKPALVGIVPRKELWPIIRKERWYHIPIASAPLRGPGRTCSSICKKYGYLEIPPTESLETQFFPKAAGPLGF